MPSFSLCDKPSGHFPGKLYCLLESLESQEQFTPSHCQEIVLRISLGYLNNLEKSKRHSMCLTRITAKLVRTLNMLICRQGKEHNCHSQAIWQLGWDNDSRHSKKTS